MDFLKDVRSEMRKVVAPTRDRGPVHHDASSSSRYSSLPPTSSLVDYVFGQGVTRLIHHFTIASSGSKHE